MRSVYLSLRERSDRIDRGDPGEGFRSIEIVAAPHPRLTPIASALALDGATSPRRGEVKKSKWTNRSYRCICISWSIAGMF